MLRTFRLAVCALSAVTALVSTGAVAGESRVPKPAITIENPGKCVAPVDEMRRNHMDMLKHTRDKTLREGVRGMKTSLNGCIECHASKKTGSVLGNENFCQSCHSYAAVSLDCWSCHQPKANFKATGALPAGHDSPTGNASTAGAKQ
ncbi:MAG: Hdr-like menaquinol oxidoreductase cytochrome c subunit [Gammaproteobacteria bacterium]|nr:Hdr-like menaquinol oxidoreductase cytochrome c subunit [Gammaproteobacteria bacterium]MBU1647240.1 Hdr-like menaquinol oxidoreductase cytochrome c subunit [Gammaproteobacteria bacterium]MBU1972752.1 Hdr-like menaquinol oxidoreductase cytochrome c subunit [Gammaproteobacteria bacterium]